MGERVVYLGRSQNGHIPDWAGDGKCEIIDSEQNRIGFGPQGSHGVAYLVKFKDTEKTLWVGEHELDDDEAEINTEETNG